MPKNDSFPILLVESLKPCQALGLDYCVCGPCPLGRVFLKYPRLATLVSLANNPKGLFVPFSVLPWEVYFSFVFVFGGCPFRSLLIVYPEVSL